VQVILHVHDEVVNKACAPHPGGHGDENPPPYARERAQRLRIHQLEIVGAHHAAPSEECEGLPADAPELALAKLLDESQKRNYEKWPIFGRFINPNYYAWSSYEEEIGFLTQSLRITEEALACYQANLAQGIVERFLARPAEPSRLIALEHVASEASGTGAQG